MKTGHIYEYILVKDASSSSDNSYIDYSFDNKRNKKQQLKRQYLAYQQDNNRQKLNMYDELSGSPETTFNIKCLASFEVNNKHDLYMRMLEYVNENKLLNDKTFYLEGTYKSTLCKSCNRDIRTFNYPSHILTTRHKNLEKSYLRKS